MRVLHINESDAGGGAAKAAYRLHRALLKEGVDSLMLVQRKFSDDNTVIGSDTKIQKGIAMIRPTLDQLPIHLYKNRTKNLFSPAWLPFSSIVNKINELNPDIVHLHWVCGGMIKIEDLAKIKAPIVWSLHDNWAFTGGCHLKWECEKYKDRCGACPILGSYKENDLSRKVWIRKQKTFSKLQDMTIIGLSRWMANCAKESSLFKDKRILNLPNPIDTELFKPFDKDKARELWSLPKDKKLVLFGAMSATSDINKGFEQLRGALHKLKSKDIELVVFGSSEPKEPQNFGFKTYYLGRLYDDISLVTLYSAVDVTVVPSLQENLSNVIMESLSCGTPVVAFDIGGNSDMIDHQKCGYLAKPYDTTDLARGIDWLINSSDYKKLSRNGIKKVLSEFDSKIVVKEYVKLYIDIIE
jgi:glycosyltransferase involved in cell wall biosynthesis